MYWAICVEMGIDPPPALLSGRLRFRVLLITGTCRGAAGRTFSASPVGVRDNHLFRSLSCSRELYRMQNAGPFTLANTTHGKDFVATRDRTEHESSVFSFKDTSAIFNSASDTRDKDDKFATVVIGE
ncbi:hypothetical protein DFH09DRAFT_1079870 [Mycena vulgaris]|nr:hypothetical protein DFH09DRAFT_1079870 [Mycena vulgaris]